MTLGTEHKEQVYLLMGLVVVAGYLVYVNLRPKSPTPDMAPRRHSPPTQPYRPRTAVGTNRVPDGAALLSVGGQLL